MAYALFGLLCLVWGSSFILMKKATAVFDPVAVGLFRVAGGAAVLAAVLALAWWRRRPGLTLPRRAWGWIWIPAILGMAYPFAMQPLLIHRYQDSGFFGMMTCLVPLSTIVARVPVLKQGPTARELIGVLGGLGFVVLLFTDGPVRGVPPEAIGLAVTVPACYALSNTLVKRLLSPYPPLTMTASAMALATLIYLPLLTPSMQSGGLITAPPTYVDGLIAVAAVLLLGMVGTGLATWVFFYLVQQKGPLFAGMVTYLVSGIAVAWGYLDGEPLTVRQIVALLGILSMVAVVQWPSKEKPTA